MESWLQEIFRWLPSGGPYYILIFFISLLESLALVGLFMPGSVLIVFAGFLAAHGKGTYLSLVIASTAGAMLGDLISFWLGARMGSTLLNRPSFQKRIDLFRKSQVFFIEHGGKSVLLGRFFGPLRPFIPFVAGSSHMNPKAFTAFALLAGALWGLAYPGIGYFFGSSWNLVRLWLGRFSFLVAALIGLVILNQLFWRKWLPKLSRLAVKFWHRLAYGWGQVVATPFMRKVARRHPALWNFIADRFSLQHGTGLYLTSGFLFSACLSLIFIWALGPLQPLDYRIYELIPEMRHPYTDIFFLGVTRLGDGAIIAIAGGWVCLWLCLSNRFFSATILLVGTAGGQALVYLLKFFFARPRPTPFFETLAAHSPSFPSAHAFAALVFYGLLIYVLLGTVKNLQDRFSMVVTGSFLAMLVGCSRVYLGVHWFTDVVGGFALAAVWLLFLITACEMRIRNDGEFPWGKKGFSIRLRKRLRSGILLIAAAAALLSAGSYLRYRLQSDWPGKFQVTESIAPSLGTATKMLNWPPQKVEKPKDFG